MEQTKSRGKSPAARILSLALALCMIAAFVPAFTLTVGAADALSDTVINGMITEDTIVFDGRYSTGTYKAGDCVEVENIYTDWNTLYWTGTDETTYKDLNDSGYTETQKFAGGVGIQGYKRLAVGEESESYRNSLKFRWDGGTASTGTSYAFQMNAGDGYGITGANTYVAVEFTGYTNYLDKYSSTYSSYPYNFYESFYLYDKDGNMYANFTFDKNGNTNFDGKVSVLGRGTSSDPSIWLRIVAVNRSDSTYDVYYQTDTDGDGVYTTEASTLGVEGSVNGYGALVNYMERWNGNNMNSSGTGIGTFANCMVSLNDFTVYSGSVPTDSTAASIIDALDALELPIRADEETDTFALPTSATDTYGTSVTDVTWVSDSDVITIADGTATVKVTDKVEYVHLTPSATHGNATVTGNAHTIVVFPASRAGDTYSDGTTSYTIGSENKIDNGSFEGSGKIDLDGWTNAATGAILGLNDLTEKDHFFQVSENQAYNKGKTLDVTTAIPADTYALGTRWNDGTAGLCSIHTFWEVEANKSYYLSFYAKSSSGANDSRVIKATYTTTAPAYVTSTDEEGNTVVDTNTYGAATDDIDTYSVTTTTEWVKYEYVFTTTDAGYITFYAYNLGSSSNAGAEVYNMFDDFELYEATAIEETLVSADDVSITVISGTTPVLPSTVTGTGDQGNTMTAEVEWEDITSKDFKNTGSTATTVKVTGTVKDTDITVTASIEVVPLSYTLDDVTATASQSYDSNKDKQYIALLDEIVGEAYIELEYTPNGLTDNWIYINNGETIWGGGQIGIGTGKSDTNILKAQASSALEIGTIEDGNTYRLLIHTDVSQDSDTYTVVMSDLANNTVSSEVTQSYRTSASQLDRIVFTTNGSATSFTLSNIKVYDPNCKVITYNVAYIDSSTDSAITDTPAEGTADATYTTTVDNTLGYNDTVVCDYVPIPYFTGYVFKSKSVSGDTITLTYEPTDTEAYFFTDADDDATIISLNMLGAHDAFTANMDDVKYDAAGIATGDSGSENYITYRGSDTAVNMSKAQSADALTMLNHGVRYFDVRVSRSTEAVDYEPTILGISTGTTYTAPHTNGVFYTTHGGLSDEFRPIAYTIGQWAKEHPGEIIILNFQSAFEDGGSATTDTWSAINDILDEAGINDFVSIKNSNAGSGNLAGATIASYTDNREHAGILVFGQSTGANNNIGNFILNKYGDEFSGRLYSNYETELDSNISSSYSAAYIQAQVDYANEFGSGADNHIITWMLRVMQGQSESTNLVSRASSDNTSLYEALAGTEHTDWLTALPIIMVNDAVTNTDELLTLLQAHNKAREVSVVYVDSEGNQVATKTKSVMTGTLYTDETLYGVVDGGETKYYVSTVPTTVLNNGILPVPSSGNIESVTVTALGDVYTYVADNAYNNTPGTVITGNLITNNDEPKYGYENFGAYNWTTGDGYDRIGVAVLPVTSKDETQNYVLKATEIRGYNTTVAHSVSFYAISYNTYKFTDFGDSSAVVELLNSEYAVNTEYSQAAGTNERSDLTTVAYTLDLNEALTALTTDGGKIVILGVSKGGLYGLDGSTMTITAETKDLGIDLIDGAQIRVGSGATEAALAEDSGLRFIADVSLTDTLAGIVDKNSGTEGYEIGIAIYDGGYEASIDAEAVAKEKGDNGWVMQIPMTMAQKDANGEDTSIYTVAITNIDPSNFNRIYIAVPYVTVDGETVYDYTEAVARTPYQVAAGILVNDGESSFTVDDTTYTYTANSETLIAALNLYANLTGARIELTKSGSESEGYTYTAGSVKYSNGAEVFFSLTATNDEDGYYVITLSPRGSAKFNSEYAVDKFRANNATASSFTSATSDLDSSVTLVDGNLVIKFRGTGAVVTENAD